jgi:tRNA pseudouridine32 synthase / 23S rRNA pseudouridine746 synthase
VTEKITMENHTSLLRVFIRTGRKHQIRRHLDMIGFPVPGDPRYGSGNKNTDGMCLTASALSFQCPLTGFPCRIQWPDDAQAQSSWSKDGSF